MPFRPALYKDLNKRSSDLLTKDFPSEKKENKLDWKGKTSSNLSFETSFTQRNDGSVLGIFSPKYNIKEWNTTLTAELKTNKDFKLEVSADNQFAPGLKTTVSGESKGEDLIGTVAVEYKHDVATFTGSVDYGQASGSNIKASSVLGTQGFSFGASVDYFVGSSNDSSLREVNAVASYSTAEFDVSAFGKIQNEKDSTILGANYFHNVSSDVQVGGEISFDTQNPDTKPKLVAASTYRIDPDASIKAKFDTNGKLGLSYSQSFKNVSRLVLSGTVDTNNLSAKNASSIGFNLSLF